MVPRSLLILLAALVAACNPSLPEPDSVGAGVYRERCGSCHRLSAPSSMTFPMWEQQLARMHGRFAERGVPWLTPDEERVLRAYLEQYAGRE